MIKRTSTKSVTVWRIGPFRACRERPNATGDQGFELSMFERSPWFYAYLGAYTTGRGFRRVLVRVACRMFEWDTGRGFQVTRV
jgi:hypothetical protein